jgi:uncharacterized protein YggE
MKNVRAAGILYFVASAPLVAQSAASSPPVEIRTSAVTTIELPAAGAVLTVNFSTQRKTPGEAGRANAERATAIRRAILALGVPGDSITTRGYSSTLNVGPYQRDTTFVASNTVHVRMSRLALISAVIDTALAEGATGIAGLQFWADGVAQARLDAIAAATRRARTQAETLADAAGGRVGRLLELATDPPTGRGVSPFDFGLSMVTTTASHVPTPIQAPTVNVAVTVYTRWEFLPDRD